MCCTEKGTRASVATQNPRTGHVEGQTLIQPRKQCSVLDFDLVAQVSQVGMAFYTAPATTVPSRRSRS